MSVLLEDDRRSLEHMEGLEVFIQHDFDFYSVCYYKGKSNEPVFFLKDQESGKFKQLQYGRWYMGAALGKLKKISANEKHLIDEELVNGFWYAIREGYNHQLDPNLKREYDTPRIQNTIKAVKAYIDRIAQKGKERFDSIMNQP